MSASSRQSERVFKRITAHLRAQVAELRRLERAGAPAGELAERRREIAQLQSHLAGAVRSAVAPARVALGAPPD